MKNFRGYFSSLYVVQRKYVQTNFVLYVKKKITKRHFKNMVRKIINSFQIKYSSD